MLSQDVKAMKTGDVRSAFLLTREGGPIALFLVWACRGPLPPHVRRVRRSRGARASRALRDRRRRRDRTSVRVPRAVRRRDPSRGRRAIPLEPGRFTEIPSGSSQARRDVGGRPADLPWARRSPRPPAERFVRACRVSDLVGSTTSSTPLRVEEGVPAVGRRDRRARAADRDRARWTRSRRRRAAIPGRSP